MNIDWSIAPEWAVAHALYAFGGEISEVWVGEEQYQRLDQPKPFPYGGGAQSSFHNPRRYQFRYETLRPLPWNGEGLPPAGTVCEFTLHRGAVAWATGTVIGNEGPNQVVIKYGRTEYHARNIHGVRPIRTAEQIAAEERAAAIEEIRQLLMSSAKGSIESVIYDAGYRKQVAP